MAPPTGIGGAVGSREANFSRMSGLAFRGRVGFGVMPPRSGVMRDKPLRETLAEVEKA
jgi:hypothetical protein